MKKEDYLKQPVRHIDVASFNAVPLIDGMRSMSFTARDLARACDIYDAMLRDDACSIILTLAGSAGAGGCLKIYSDLVRYNMVDAIVATGASIVDMDFFEALGFRHYQGSALADDSELRRLYIDRIYDTYIDEEDLQVCDRTVSEIADALEPRPYSSRELIKEMGKYLFGKAQKKDSLVESAYREGVPIFCPAFSDCSAGFGLVLHQHRNPGRHLSVDSVKDFYELTRIKIQAGESGLVMIGGGVPKNFAQDTVICAELLGKEVPQHKYAVQITVADVRDGALSSSTLKEAQSWGKVEVGREQMVFAEATSVLPLMASYLYHQEGWKKRRRRRYTAFLDESAD